MGKKPKLEKLDYLFNRGEDFELTGTQYKKLTGVDLPKSKSYLCNDSALARWADKKGFVIKDVQERPIIEKTVSFNRKEK